MIDISQIRLPVRVVDAPRPRLRPALALLAGAMLTLSGAAMAQTAIVTHHYDNARSGWNRTETILTPDNVGTPGPAGTFGLLATVPLDGSVDAQPLVAPNVQVEGDPNPGTHDVVYVATQGNTVYAIDPTRGTVLRTRNFGAPVPNERGCEHTDIGIGITGTPVLDPVRHTLYVVAYTNDPVGGGKFSQVYRLHALDLSTLADKVAPVVISAEQTLIDGTTMAFRPAIHRQRPALLEYGRTIYVTMGSFCDNSRARGWVMGYSAATLQPLAKAADGTPLVALTNREVHAPNGYFLSALWMSGAGPAADANGIYYVTSNSDMSGTTYDPLNNTEQSIVRLSHDTTTVLDLFTPSNLPALDLNDKDFGSGGVTLIPSTRAGEPPMAAAAGKFGTLYLVDRTNLGGYTPGGPDKALASVTIGPCWCQPSYFDDGVPTLVSSGGTQIMLWQVHALPKPALVQRAVSPALNTNSLGFFTSVSSNGRDNTIVWAVTHPVRANGPGIFLYAFGVGERRAPLTQLFVGAAGNWNAQRHLPNIVPVVANGLVYVASDSGLEIFGLGAPPGN